MPKTFEDFRKELGDDYEDVDDAYEIRINYEKYEQASAKLLEKIEQRDELVALLKYATRARVPEVRAGIAEFDTFIEKMEKYVALRYETFEKTVSSWRRFMELEKMMNVIKPELYKYVAEEMPERLEELEALLSDDQKTH